MRCFGLEIVAGSAGRGCGFQAWALEVLPELFISALRTEAMFGDLSASFRAPAELQRA